MTRKIQDTALNGLTPATMSAKYYRPGTRIPANTMAAGKNNRYRDLKEAHDERESVKIMFGAVFEHKEGMEHRMEMFSPKPANPLRTAAGKKTVTDREADDVSLLFFINAANGSIEAVWCDREQSKTVRDRVHGARLKKTSGRLRPRLEFLDIQMPRTGGFGRTAEIPFEVIFVTGHDQYAGDTVQSDTLDHLLRRLETEGSDLTPKMAVEHIRQKTENRLQIVNLPPDPGHEPGTQKIAIHQADSVQIIDAKNIAYIEADGSYCRITTHNDEHYMLSKYLKDMEGYFGENSFFVRINKSVLLNTQYITRYTKGEPYIIQMCDGKDFEVSRRKKHEVLQKLKQAVLKCDLPDTGRRSSYSMMECR